MDFIIDLLFEIIPDLFSELMLWMIPEGRFGKKTMIALKIGVCILSLLCSFGLLIGIVMLFSKVPETRTAGILVFVPSLVLTAVQIAVGIIGKTKR